MITDESDIEKPGVSASASEDDMGFEASKIKIPPWPKGTMAFIPPNVLSRSLATRLKMTPTQQAAFTQGLITESGGDISAVATSYVTADRSRRKVVGKLASKIQDDWVPPKLCTLHWDGKMTIIHSNKSLCH